MIEAPKRPKRNGRPTLPQALKRTSCAFYLLPREIESMRLVSDRTMRPTSHLLSDAWNEYVQKHHPDLAPVLPEGTGAPGVTLPQEEPPTGEIERNRSKKEFPSP